jgi:phage tail sheath protein FI
VSTAVIGPVATAPDADNEAFPSTPLCCSPILRAASARLARAAPWPSADSHQWPIPRHDRRRAWKKVLTIAATTSNVIGTMTATGQRTGIQACCRPNPSWRQAPHHRRPRAGHQEVANALASAAKSLRAFTYVAARNATGGYAQTKEEATAYRKEFGQREVMVLWPNFLAWDNHRRRDGNRRSRHPGAPAYALGLRAKLDQEVGWHKNISNAVINGPEGITVPVFFDLQNPASDAGYLNAQEVTTIIRRSGYRFWDRAPARSKAASSPLRTTPARPRSWPTRLPRRTLHSWTSPCTPAWCATCWATSTAAATSWAVAT